MGKKIRNNGRISTPAWRVQNLLNVGTVLALNFYHKNKVLLAEATNWLSANYGDLGWAFCQFIGPLTVINTLICGETVFSDYFNKPIIVDTNIFVFKIII